MASSARLAIPKALIMLARKRKLNAVSRFLASEKNRTDRLTHCLWTRHSSYSLGASIIE